MKDSILNGVLIFSILQAFLFSLLSFTKRNKSLPDNLIGIWLFVVSVQTILIFILHNNLISGILIHIPVIITLLFGPLQYLYVFKIYSGGDKLKVHELIHFIPFLFFLISDMLFSASGLFLKILAVSCSIMGLTYSVITLCFLHKHSLKVKIHFSYTEKINLSWLYKLVIGLMMIWSGVVVLVFLRRIFHFDLSLDWFYTPIPIFIFYIGYHGIKQQVIYPLHHSVPEQPDLPANEEKSGSDKKGYQKSGLQPTQMQTIYQKMLHAMQSDDLFRHPTLSLQEISDKLAIPQHHITQTLNEHIGLNFYDFVNSYRVDEFKKRVDLGDADNYSLLGIAFDCGFNSKSSFNRIFKNTTGMTPSEYRSGRT